MIKLTIKDRWFIFWGFPFLLNKKSREIHNLKNIDRSCSVDQMAEHNKRYISKSTFEKAITTGIKFNGYVKRANGCRWCLKKHDTG